MTTEQKLQAWSSILSVAYDCLSANEFEYLLGESPYKACRQEHELDYADDETPEMFEEYEIVEPWEPTARTKLFFC